MGVLWVALGGACGAAARYGISLLPVRMDFPVLTLATNFLGALLIGVIVGLAGGGRLTADQTLFWKTGVCGGFTTFSTFSLETLTLPESGRIPAGCLYMALSLGICVLGVALGWGLCAALFRG